MRAAGVVAVATLLLGFATISQYCFDGVGPYLGITVHHTSLYWWRGLVLAQSIRHSEEQTVFVRINSVQQLCVVHMVCTQQLLVSRLFVLLRSSSCSNVGRAYT